MVVCLHLPQHSIYHCLVFVPVQFPITLDQTICVQYELSTSTEQKILTTLKGLIIDD